MMPVVAALDTATRADAGLPGFVLVIAIGMAMGSLFSWLLWTTGRVVGKNILHRRSPSQRWYFRALYFAALLWIIVVGVVAQHTLPVALRLR
jgi:uncharacterized membrane-anchored protein